MEDRPATPESPVPASVSHRQLAEWLQQAPHEAEHAAAQAQASADPAADENLEALFTSWADSSRQLLEALQRSGTELGRNRSPRQMMALGALHAHLVMALQALAAAGRRREDR